MERTRVGRKIRDRGDEGAPASQVTRSAAERARVNYDEADLLSCMGKESQAFEPKPYVAFILGSTGSTGGNRCLEIREQRTGMFIRAGLQTSVAAARLQPIFFRPSQLYPISHKSTTTDTGHTFIH
jgi:hypothetical protein